MSSTWRKVVDPVTGKSRFTNEPVQVSSAPVNAKVKRPQTRVSDAVEDFATCACGEPIEGRGVRALGLFWHPQCFACDSCSKEFETNCLKYTPVTASGGVPTSEEEAAGAWCARCAVARDSATGSGADAAGAAAERAFHDVDLTYDSDPVVIRTRLSNEPVRVGGGAQSADALPLAKVLTGQVNAPAPSGDAACFKCGSPIETGAVVHWEDRRYHPGCFLCPQCQQPVDGGAGFARHDDEPYHKECYKRAVAPKCQMCHEPVVGKAYNVGGNKIHVGCFVCAVCSASLASGHIVVDGQYLCRDCRTKQRQAPIADFVAASAAPAAAPSTAQGSFCTSCGTARDGDAKFCGQCGTKF